MACCALEVAGSWLSLGLVLMLAVLVVLVAGSALDDAAAGLGLDEGDASRRGGSKAGSGALAG